jgi:flagellar biosynthetic protein FliQ
MESLSVFDALKNAMWVTLMTSLPILITAMIVGLLVGVLQTATSIQEQTLAFIPKIVAIFLALLLFGPWIFQTIGDMARQLFGSLHRFIQ